MTTISKTFFKKGDVVTIPSAEKPIAYIFQEIDRRNYATLYSIQLNEIQDDIVIMQLYINSNEIEPVEESLINQIGYLMIVLREKIMKNEPFFYYEDYKKRMRDINIPHSSMAIID